MKPRQIICLGCPNGCHVEVSYTDDQKITVSGADCERGEEYACEEVREPKRMVTAVVRTDSADVPFVPVKSERAVPKALIPGLLQEVYRRQAALPIRLGDALFDNYADSGIGVVFTRSVPGV